MCGNAGPHSGGAGGNGNEDQGGGNALAHAVRYVALLLASIGLHGVPSHSVTRRTSEIGVRVALAAAPLIGSLLFGVGPGSPWAIAALAGVVLAVAVGAGLLPAVRAARLDALVALRSE